MVCQDLDSTLHFYQDILGMEAVAWQPTPDDPSFSQLYLHAGSGTILAFVGPSEPSRTPLAKGRLGVGSIQCLALQLEEDAFEEAQDNLRQKGVPFTGPVERGHERAMWVRDPNGITLELTSWRTPLPEVVQLFNIADDPGETKNLAAEHADVVAQLKARANELAATQTKPFMLVTEFNAIRERLAMPPALPTEPFQMNTEH